MPYVHTWLDGHPVPFPPGKIVCVGRNYYAHIQEMGSTVPAEPVLFMKPQTAYAAFSKPIHLPSGQGSCHHELELALLVGAEARAISPAQAWSVIAGYALALDLTLRDLQDRLKDNGLPWEKSKAFDGACPITPFIAPEMLPDPESATFRLKVNGTVRQSGNVAMMMTSIPELLAHMTSYFTLLPGDVVLTGTPSGVGPLLPGDRLTVTLNETHHFTTVVAEPV